MSDLLRKESFKGRSNFEKFYLDVFQRCTYSSKRFKVQVFWFKSKK